MTVDNNMVVAIEYEVKEASSGELVDSNKGGDPLEFITGMGQVIPGLEKEIMGMSKGESKQITVPAGDAYGDYDDNAVQPHEKEQFAGIELEVGMTLYGQSETGQTVQVTVREIEGDQVVIDYNHPLAGKDLSFELTVQEVRQATDDELESGAVDGGGGCCGGGNQGEGGGCCGSHR